MKNKQHKLKTKLFSDTFVTDKGFKSTEGYILNQLRDNAPYIGFPSLEYYSSLIKEKWLEKGDHIRTSYKGMIDENYYINSEDGMLKGVHNIPAYQGRKGIFTPEEILGKNQRFPPEWTVIRETFLRKKIVNDLLEEL